MSSSNNENNTVIKLESVCKSFQIYDKPHHRLMQGLLRGKKQYFREFKALDDISFEVKKGETIGIIGRNGAGKSTLLQIICGTMSQTTGDILVNGRMAALLELGAGFKSEFTGRENVFMYASILGLTRKQIEERFDDIAAFADIGDFLEQPVKTYSSGMYVRLAFSVVIHIEPEILIVDEALAVGDAFFQAKCVVAMKKLMDAGVTLLFVSHDVGAVKALCERAVLLDKGKISAIGDTNSVVEKYYENKVNDEQSSKSVNEDNQTVQKNIKILKNDSVINKKVSGLSAGNVDEFNNLASFQRIQKGKAEFLNVMLVDDVGDVVNMCEFGEKVTLRMFIRILEDLPRIGLAYHIRDKNGFDIVYSDTGIEQKEIIAPKAGSVYVFEWSFHTTLKQGDYVVAAMASIPVDLSIGEVEVCDFVPLAVQLKVVRGESLPMHGAVHWSNSIYCELVKPENEDG